MTDLAARIRASLGKVPTMAARGLAGQLAQGRCPEKVDLRYEWIKDWLPLSGLEVQDGQEWLTVWVPNLTNTDTGLGHDEDKQGSER